MVFSDTVNKLGLIQDCEMNIFGNYGDISSNPDRLYDFTARLNRAYDKLATKIMSCDGRWQFDDTNYTDLPIGSTNIVSGQQDYSLSVEHMDIVRVVLTDSSGNKSVLRPIDITDPQGRRYITDTTTTGGIPTQYDKFGGTLMLIPTPNFNRTLGLTIYYRRKPSYFVYGDTTKPVGVPGTFHRYLSLEASLDYAISKRLDMKKDLADQVAAMEATILEFFSMRNKDENKFIGAVITSSR